MAVTCTQSRLPESSLVESPSETQINNSNGQISGVHVKPDNVWIVLADQMKKLWLQQEILLAGQAELNRELDEMKKRDARRDHFMFFSQVVETFVGETFLGPFNYRSDFFDKLESGEDVEFCEQVKVLGAPMGITVEHILEWEQFVEHDGMGGARPSISKADFIEVAKELIEDRQLSESSIGVLEKVFDGVNPNQM